MSVVNISSSRNLPEADLEQLAQLAVTLSRRLTRVPLDGHARGDRRGARRDRRGDPRRGCRLLEFTESGAVARVHCRDRR